MSTNDKNRSMGLENTSSNNIKKKRMAKAPLLWKGKNGFVENKSKIGAMMDKPFIVNYNLKEENKERKEFHSRESKSTKPKRKR